MQQRRIALYSPGMVGLGHMRRNLLIAQALSSGSSRPAVLLIAEAREASALAMPQGVDCLTLPALQKHADGSCRPRHLELSLAQTVELRSRTIAAALGAFDPDLLIVDHLPHGARGELQAALQCLRASGGTRCVLGLRDIIESPDIVREEWRGRGYEDAIDSHFDAVWIYGDPAVFDPIREYELPPNVTDKLRFAGYLDTRTRLQCAGAEGEHLLSSLDLPDGRLALCLVGGGADGESIATAFVKTKLPADTHGVAVTGPFMPTEIRKRLYHLAARHPRMRVLDFVIEPAFLVRRADWIVTMGGYNSVCDVLAFEKRALVVPRTYPRCEQRLRAERLQALGLVDMLPPDAVSPRALEWWFGQQHPSTGVRHRVDLSGLARLPHFVEDVLHGVPAPATLPAARAV
jgi:predicted glycosyltransferase